MITINKTLSCGLATVFLLASLTACEKTQTGKPSLSGETPVEIGQTTPEEMPVETGPKCEGQLVKTAPVNSDIWQNGIGRQNAAFLFGADTFSDVNAVKTIHILSEAAPRKIKSVTTLPNGMHFVRLEGKYFATEDFSAICAAQ